MSNKKWTQQQIADAAEFVHEGVMSRVDRRFPSQDALISAHNENAIDIQCELIESLTREAALTKQVASGNALYQKIADIVDAEHPDPNSRDSEWDVLPSGVQSAINRQRKRAEKADVELATAKAQVDVYKQVMSELRAELATLRSWMRQLTTAMSNREWADSLTTDIDAAALEEQITAVHSELAALREGSTVTYRADVVKNDGYGWSLDFQTEDAARNHAAGYKSSTKWSIVEVISRERILDEKGEG